MVSVPQPEPYEPPEIEARERIDVPLVGGASLPARSAAFRTITAYEPSRIVERTGHDVSAPGGDLHTTSTE